MRASAAGRSHTHLCTSPPPPLRVRSVPSLHHRSASQPAHAALGPPPCGTRNAQRQTAPMTRAAVPERLLGRSATTRACSADDCFPTASYRTLANAPCPLAASLGPVAADAPIDPGALGGPLAEVQIDLTADDQACAPGDPHWDPHWLLITSPTALTGAPGEASWHLTIGSGPGEVAASFARRSPGSSRAALERA
eukprot:1329628-Prymnesium_polylepis.1